MKILKPIIWIIIIIAIVAGGLYLMKNVVNNQEKQIAKLKDEISSLKEVITPIRYKVTSRNGDMMTVAVKFYDLDSNKIGKTQKFELKGNTVSFDFYIIEYNKQFLAIPYKIFTDMIKPEDGTVIYNYYEEDEFPMIYYSKNSTKGFSQGINALYKKIKSGDIQDMKNIFGNMVQNHPQANGSQNQDMSYKIVFHKNVGTIKILEDNK